MATAEGSIVMVAYTYYPWDPRVRREAETLVRAGHRVSVVCARDAGQPGEEAVGGVMVHRVPLPIRRGGPLRYLYQYSVFFLLAMATTGRIRRRHSLVAIHAHSLPDFIAFIGFGSRLRGTPLILDLHEAMPEIYAARFPASAIGRRLALAAEKASALIANRVIVVNETIRDILIERGIPSERLIVIYNSPDTQDGHEEIAGLPRESGDLHLVYAGGVDRERDLVTLVRAVAALRKIRPVSLYVFGPGPAEYRGYLEGLADGLGLRGAVHFGGVLPQDSVLAHLANADVGVVTFERNPITEVGLPNRVFEYALLDKPLVLPNLRAMQRTFEGAALFYEPGDPDDLAAKIGTAARGGSRVDGMRARSRAVYEASKWEVQAQRLAAAYAAVGAGE